MTRRQKDKEGSSERHETEEETEGGADKTTMKGKRMT